jgi:P-type conjugative transfer protein TrbJ
MKRQLRGALIALALASLIPEILPLAHAQAVFCTNCSSEVTQLLNLARLIDQLTTQGNILTTGNNQLQNMTVNTAPLNSLQWNNGASNLNSVNSILAGATSLSFANGGVSSLFGQQYGTYNTYLGAPSTSQAFAAKYQQWSSNSNSSVLSTLQAGNTQSSQITGSEQAAINGLKAQTGSVTGNLQALQTIAQAGLLNIQQLQALRQLILTDTSLKANQIQIQNDALMSQQAAWRTFLNTQQNIPAAGGRRF